jgi:hypothetical protein
MGDKKEKKREEKTARGQSPHDPSGFPKPRLSSVIPF